MRGVFGPVARLQHLGRAQWLPEDKHKLVQPDMCPKTGKENHKHVTAESGGEKTNALTQKVGEKKLDFFGTAIGTDSMP